MCYYIYAYTLCDNQALELVADRILIDSFISILNNSHDMSSPGLKLVRNGEVILRVVDTFNDTVLLISSDGLDSHLSSLINILETFSSQVQVDEVLDTISLDPPPLPVCPLGGSNG